MRRDKPTIGRTGLRKRVVIVMMSPTFLLDMAGPADVFNLADRLLRRSGARHGYDVTVVSPIRRNRVIWNSEIAISCKYSAVDIKGKIDTLLVVGDDLAKPESPTLALVEQDYGKEIATEIARKLVVFAVKAQSVADCGSNWGGFELKTSCG